MAGSQLDKEKGTKMTIDPNGVFGVIAGLVFLVVLATLFAKNYPAGCADFLRRLRSPGTAQIKKQADEMLAQMDRNIAERKARK